MQYGWTALHSAAYFGHHAVTLLLLGRGADIHAKDKVSRPNQSNIVWHSCYRSTSCVTEIYAYLTQMSVTLCVPVVGWIDRSP